MLALRRQALGRKAVVWGAHAEGSAVPVANGDSVPEVYVFGPFSLDPLRRTLTRDGKALALSPRGFDVLLCLLQNPDRIVDRTELARAAWGSRIVEVGNIRQTVYEVRKVLEPGEGPRFIATVPLRGYQIAAPVQRIEAAGTFSARPAAARGLPWIGKSRLLLLASLVPAAAIALAMLPPVAERPPGQSPLHSVAVLPFTISGQSGSQDAFADGLSAELTDALNRIGGLRVLAPTSSFPLRDRPIAATEVARRLNVGAVLEGSIARDGARISMVAELVDAGTGFTLWSHRYDSESANLLDAQANIAEAVAASLQGTLANGHPVAAAGGTHNEAAYDLYLRGLQYARDATDEPARQTARASFEAAIALDPTFALARAWRAREMAAIVYAGTATPAESQPLLAEARAEADRALALAPDLGLAHLALAEIAKLQQNFPEAQREISLAREDAPNDIQVLTDAVFMEVEFGHPEAARKLAELGVSLDPLSPSVYTALGYAQWVLRDYDGARASLRHARLLGTNTPHTGMIEAVVALDQGDNQEAEEVCAHRVGGWMGDLCSAVAEHRLGHASEAELHFAALRNSLGMSGAFHYAEVYAQWSQSAEALKWLDVAYRTHGAALAMMKTDSLLEPIRKMPQFAAIERRLRYPP